MMIVTTAKNVTESMNGQNELRQAIELMQDGKVAPAADLLHCLIADNRLDDKGRAAAYVWLAESREDGAFKIRCLEQALQHDPNNQQIRQGLQQVMAAPPPPSQRPAFGPALRRSKFDAMPAVVGILGGLNGPASGVFINDDGMIATTSYAIGSASRATAMLDAKRHVPATVVRRFPTHDLVLIQTALRPAEKPNAAPPSTIAEGTAFVALGYGGAKLRGLLGRLNSRQDAALAADKHRAGSNAGRGRQSAGRREWAAAGFAHAQCRWRGKGAGDQNVAYRVAGRAADARTPANARFPLLRHLRRTGAGAAFWRQALRDLWRGAGRRCPPNRLCRPKPKSWAALYGENAARPCPRCGARVGDYDGRCLRCGRSVAVNAAARS